MSIRSAALLLLLATTLHSNAQSFNRDPGNPNLDCSAGDFSYWNLGWGPRTQPDSAAGPQPGAASHTITPIYGTNWDGNAGTGKLARVPSGLTTVVRFGSPAGGGYGSPRAYSMSYPIKIDKRYPVLFLQLASVMDKTHYNDYNTHYRFRLTNTTGADIPARPCTGLELYPMGTAATTSQNVATLPDIGWKLLPETGTIAYQPWQSIAINLAAYAGQTVTLTFEHFDCWTGFHGSYEYLAAGMQPLTDTFYYCQSDTLTTLSPYIPRFKSYRWNTGDTTQQLTVHHPVDNTLYTCTVESYNNCTTQFNYRLRAINTTADFNTSPGSTCRELNFHDLSVTSKGNISAWHWQFGDAASGAADASTGQNPIHTFTSAGDYTITLDLLTTEGCHQHVEKKITVQEANITAGYTSTASGECRGYTFHDTSATTKGTITNWHWQFGDSATGINDTSNLQHPAHTFSQPGLYTIQLLVNSSIGCAARNTTQLLVPDIQTPQIRATDNCLGIPTIAYTEQPQPIHYNWHIAEDADNQYSDTARYVYPETGTHNIILYYTDSNHCTDSITTSATVYTPPTAALKASPARASVNAPEFVFTASPGGMQHYNWDFGAGEQQTTTTTSLSHRFAPDIQDHTITLNITDGNGCKDTTQLTVTVSAMQVFIPSAFSPNNDQQNDLFRLINITDQQLENFSIYNRYGERIFHTTDPAQGWDGTYNGTQQDIGSYYYIVTLIYPDGHKEILKGDVSLIR